MFIELMAQSSMPEIEEPAWSPYLVGSGIGVLSWLTFYFSRQALGASGGYAILAGLLGRALAPALTLRLPYFRDNPPHVNWSVMLLVGMLMGAIMAAWSGGEFTNRYLPPMWAARFGHDSAWLRSASAFGGGVLMAYGARLAGGCTSGHGISGNLQLLPASWISSACFFVGGIVTAFLLYRT